MSSPSPTRILLLLKRIIPGGARADLFANEVAVGPYVTKRGVMVAAHRAVRHKKLPTKAPAPMAPAAPAPIPSPDLFGAPAQAVPPPKRDGASLHDIARRFVAMARADGHEEQARAAEAMLGSEGALHPAALQDLIRQVAAMPASPPAHQPMETAAASAAPSAPGAVRVPDPAWAMAAIAAEGEVWKPRVMDAPKAMFRSVSPAELADIAAKGAVIGGGNLFSDTRRHVFMADHMERNVIHQGEELDRQAYMALRDSPEDAALTAAEANLEHARVAYAKASDPAALRAPGGRAAKDRAAEVKWEAGDAHREASDAYRARKHAWMRERQETLKDAPYTSAVLETVPIAGGLHYSREWGMSGMQGDEYGWPSGFVRVQDIARVHLVKDGEVVRTVSPEEAGLVPEGTTKVEDGVTYALRDGRWHRVTPEEPSPALPDTPPPSSPPALPPMQEGRDPPPAPATPLSPEALRAAQEALLPLLEKEERARRAYMADVDSAELDRAHDEALAVLRREATARGLSSFDLDAIRGTFTLPETIAPDPAEWQEDSLGDAIERLAQAGEVDGRPAGAFTAEDLARRWRGHGLEDVLDMLHANTVDYALLPDGRQWMRMADYTASADPVETLRDVQNALAEDPPTPVQARLKEQAKALAAAALDQPPPSGDDMDPNSPNYRYRDTGYVAGSRKEIAAEQLRAAGRNGTRLRATDVDWTELEANPRQAKDLIVKSNLFGQVDWEGLREDGMMPAAGYLVDRVYASIAPAPAEDLPQARRDFALGLETIRDRLEACHTPDEVTEALAELRDEMTGSVMNAEEAEQYAAVQDEYRQARAAEQGAKEEHARLVDAVRNAQAVISSAKYEQEARLRRKWKPDPELERQIVAGQPTVDAAQASLREWQEAHPEALARRRELPNGWTSYDSDLGMAAREIGNRAQAIRAASQLRNAVENPLTRAWAALGPRFAAVLTWRTPKGSDAFAKHVTAAKTGKVRDWSWADKAAAERPRTTRREQAFHLIVTEQHRRRGGRPVAVHGTQELKETFGLRDVQSGNWVLSDPASAAFHTQRSAEAFADLADLLGVEDSHVSMKGRLALAFGARGKGNAGGTAARAHYEPVHRVINLTKMGGGGTLAHEWFHAMDNLVKEAEGAGAAASGDFLTERPDLLPHGELRDAFEGLRVALHAGTRRTEEKVRYTDRHHKLARYNLGANSHSNPGSVQAAIKTAPDAAAAVIAVDEFYRRRHGDMDQAHKRIRKQHQDWRTIAAAHHHGSAEGAEITLATGAPVSDFMAEAMKLDKGTAGKYWSQGREMAARAFQAWCEDRLAGQGRLNDYLSAKADNQWYRDPLFGDAKPYPEGEERHRINAAIDRLAAALARQGTLAKALGLLARAGEAAPGNGASPREALAA